MSWTRSAAAAARQAGDGRLAGLSRARRRGGRGAERPGISATTCRSGWRSQPRRWARCCLSCGTTTCWAAGSAGTFWLPGPSGNCSPSWRRGVPDPARRVRRVRLGGRGRVLATDPSDRPAPGHRRRATRSSGSSGRASERPGRHPALVHRAAAAAAVAAAGSAWMWCSAPCWPAWSCAAGPAGWAWTSARWRRNSTPLATDLHPRVLRGLGHDAGAGPSARPRCACSPSSCCCSSSAACPRS